MAWRDRWSEEDLIAAIGLERSRPLLGLNPPPEEESLEAPFQTQIRKLAKKLGYKIYHTRNSRRSDTGFPDLTMVRPVSTTSPGRLIFAEVKKPGEKPNAEQAEWLSLLNHSVPGVEAYWWQPKDWPTVVEILMSTPTITPAGETSAP